MRRCSIRTWVFKLSLSVLAGAVATWGVAWYLAWLGVPAGYGGELRFFARGDDFLAVITEKGRGSCGVRWLMTDKRYAAVLQDSWPYGGHSRLPAVIPPVQVSPESELPTWAGMGRVSGASAGLAIESGWPLPALCMAGTPSSTVESPFELLYLGRRVRGLPLTPRWPGFAINSGIAAALMLGFVECVSAGRRWARRDRGRCGGCGYDRRGLALDAVCPECGVPG